MMLPSDNDDHKWAGIFIFTCLVIFFLLALAGFPK